MRNVLPLVFLVLMWVASSVARGFAAMLVIACMTIVISGEPPPEEGMGAFVCFTLLVLFVAVITTWAEYGEFLDYRKSREQGDG